MPNTPAIVRQGASAYSMGQNAAPGDGTMVCQLMLAVGYVEEVKEKQIAAVTGLSGSGPAYVSDIFKNIVWFKTIFTSHLPTEKMGKPEGERGSQKHNFLRPHTGISKREVEKGVVAREGRGGAPILDLTGMLIVTFRDHS